MSDKKQTNCPEKLLMTNVVILSIRDLRLAFRRQFRGIKSFTRDGVMIKNEDEMKELYGFFHSDFCISFADIDGEYIYKEIERQEQERWNKKQEQNNLWNS